MDVDSFNYSDCLTADRFVVRFTYIFQLLSESGQFRLVVFDEGRDNKGMAKHYLESTVLAINKEIATHLESGKKGLIAGRYKEAKGNFEAVLRLLYKDQKNPLYQEAKDQLEQVKKKLNGEEVAS